MKKLLMYCTVFMAGTVMMFAQNPVISIIGGSTTVDWAGDLDMATTDGVTYTYSGLVVEVPAAGSGVDAGVKFRQAHDWAVNWGSASFPGGTAVNNGANIPATNGTWDVTFNISTGAYNFVPAGVVYDTVALTGNGTSINFSTEDGINYVADNASVEATTYTFSINGAGQWGVADFPAGIATAATVAIAVPANAYNIKFNKETGAYSFSFVTISVTGAGAVDWDTDINLLTQDGVTYTLANQVFAGGEIKFRLNHLWAVSWGSGTFPSGTLVSPGENFTVPAGTYNVSFNRSTAEFSFTTTAGTTTYSKGSVVVYPNPANASWTFSIANGTLTNIQIVDLTGKVVANQAANTQQATVNAAALANGVYFAKVNSAEGTSVIKVVKN